MMQQGATGIGQLHATSLAHQQRYPEGLFHAADAGAGGGQRQMGALGAGSNAACFCNMQEQTQIVKVETVAQVHGARCLRYFQRRHGGAASASGMAEGWLSVFQIFCADDSWQTGCLLM